MKTRTKSPAETAEIAAKFKTQLLEMVAKSRPAGATVVGLYGNLGSGKTTFTQAFAHAFGIEEPLTSPTYVIEKIYPIIPSLSTADSQAFTHLIHIDAYRIEHPDEMKTLGWDSIVADPHNLIVIEWPEKIALLLPTDHIHLNFIFVDETTREIEAEMIQ